MRSRLAVGVKKVNEQCKAFSWNGIVFLMKNKTYENRSRLPRQLPLSGGVVRPPAYILTYF